MKITVSEYKYILNRRKLITAVGINIALVNKNVKLMLSDKFGGMSRCLQMESWGGNAGEIDGKPCSGANFIVNAETGEFLYFGVDIKQYKKLLKQNNNNTLGILRVCAENRKFKIIKAKIKSRNIGYGIKGTVKLSKQAKETINQTIKKYNKVNNESF